MTIKESQDKIVEDFSLFEEWSDKYEHIIQMGEDLPEMDPKYKVDENLIRGCQSKVWLHVDFKDGLLHFTADSDAQITKGLVALVISAVSGHTPADIADTELYFINEIGLTGHLSQTRAGGLASMVKQIKLYALGYKVQQAQKN
ncbi:SufE family protein [Chitinophaga sedimenti]|jgi:cysteine desulfuration protein SufE|uniref:SufE family protein n=1 Tax=Chitinophaga sedimenti TaxID=2033606 RepID=UPI002006557D|nr:SufE family protein [Chitinophaga sedimenti]MCK7554390.1 SufE family protein [Chitinophaga sedimenti]